MAFHGVLLTSSVNLNVGSMYWFSRCQVYIPSIIHLHACIFTRTSFTRVGPRGRRAKAVWRGAAARPPPAATTALTSSSFIPAAARAAANRGARDGPRRPRARPLATARASSGGQRHQLQLRGGVSRWRQQEQHAPVCILFFFSFFSWLVARRGRSGSAGQRERLLGAPACGHGAKQQEEQHVGGSQHLVSAAKATRPCNLLLPPPRTSLWVYNNCPRLTPCG